jgi:uncharacterized protein (DUF924 family)
VDPAPANEPAWVAEVLAFRIEDVGEPRWWTRDDALDARIRARFAGLHAQLADGPEPTPAGVREALATVVVLDQFSRNLFRGEARAFAGDARARRVADAALARGDDRALPPAARLTLYLPFEHGEALADQDRAVALVGALGRADWTRYAEAHRAVIARFGRFPHRNAVLGRASTPEEIASLSEPMGAF